MPYSHITGRKGDPGELPRISSLSGDYQKFIGSRGFVPRLAGNTFRGRWGSETASQLIARFQETVNVTAYVLNVNGAKPGTEKLTRTTDAVVSSITQ